MWREKSEIRRKPPRGPVGNVTLRYSGREAIGMGDCPVGENAPAAATSHGEFLGIDVAALYEFVHAGHEVAIIVPGIVILNDIAEVLAVAGRTARVDVEDDVSFGGHPLKFVIKDPAVGSVWPAVDVQNQRILFLGVKVGRFLNPPLNALAIETSVIKLLGRS